MLSTMSTTALELNTSYYTTVVGSSTLDGFSVSVIEPENTTSTTYMLPPYIRITSMTVCIAVMVLGIIGNLMVPLVVLRGKDMRNSTNIFLVNLSAADLCVLVICAPTVLVEVNSGPQVWPLGEHMCKAVPFVELTVAHASVLTILAISFERYYAICEPLRAGYVCTKARATFLCLLAWVAAALCTSPMIWVSQYSVVRVTMKKSNLNDDGNIESRNIPVCLMLANTSATTAFFLLLVLVFFIVPLLLLVVLYSVIVRHLILDHSRASSTSENYHARARKQVILMLLTVVFSFFVCLAPFKTLTFYLVLAPPENVQAIDNDTLLNIVYFCRIMFYLNSAINPILYNLMSTKFRLGFLKICGLRKRRNSERSTIRSTLNATRISRRVVDEQQEDFL
ncbi:growth hormone secretagogue receptor type 1-like isoform X3 [Venturia canescens]|uniref:growth hormone secretagogue receptor type 1-like isoform X3 n=1 Tax=Venturia canescens TaxID=32260 RepID=UPI001C9CDF90|nr:growth hormone secretagogue receptor type 1-like isoform X3 [Venturia canescens]